MIREITAERALKAVGRGASRPWFMLGGDRFEYVTKFYRQGSKAMVNELVGAILARMLGLPVPEVRLVNVPIEMMRPEMGSGVAPGLHVGIRKIDAMTDFETLDVAAKKLNLINRDALYGVICFDNWVYNIDRNNDGNSLIEKVERRHKYHMVDFDCCFGYEWTVDDLGSYRTAGSVDTLPFIREHATDRSRFGRWLEAIEGVSDAQIRRAVRSVPGGWLEDPERRALEDFIIYRRNTVKKVIFGELF